MGFCTASSAPCSSGTARRSPASSSPGISAKRRAGGRSPGTRSGPASSRSSSRSPAASASASIPRGGRHVAGSSSERTISSISSGRPSWPADSRVPANGSPRPRLEATRAFGYRATGVDPAGTNHRRFPQPASLEFYFAGIHKTPNLIVAPYPGHSVGYDNEVVRDALITFSKCFRMPYCPHLIVRHTKALKSQQARVPPGPLQASHQLAVQHFPQGGFRHDPLARELIIALLELLDGPVKPGEGRAEDRHAGVAAIFARERQLHGFDDGLGCHPTDVFDDHLV